MVRYIVQCYHVEKVVIMWRHTEQIEELNKTMMDRSNNQGFGFCFTQILWCVCTQKRRNNNNKKQTKTKQIFFLQNVNFIMGPKVKQAAGWRLDTWKCHKICSLGLSLSMPMLFGILFRFKAIITIISNSYQEPLPSSFYSRK